MSTTAHRNPRTANTSSPARGGLGRRARPLASLACLTAAFLGCGGEAIDDDHGDTFGTVTQNVTANVRGPSIYQPVGPQWELKGVGDVDGNGTDDIIWLHESGQVHYWAMSRGQRTHSGNIYIPVGPQWELKGVGDVDGNGTDDIIWQHEAGQVAYWAMSRGQRTHSGNIYIPVGAQWDLKGVGDVDGNGTDDIVWQHEGGQVAYWAMSRGQRTHSADIYRPVGANWSLEDVGDVDGNGTEDIVWKHDGGQVHYWAMHNGQRLGGYNIHVPVGPQWTLAGVGDVDGDWLDDVVWQHESGQVHYWPMGSGVELRASAPSSSAGGGSQFGGPDGLRDPSACERRWGSFGVTHSLSQNLGMTNNAAAYSATLRNLPAGINATEARLIGTDLSVGLGCSIGSSSVTCSCTGSDCDELARERADELGALSLHFLGSTPAPCVEHATISPVPDSAVRITVPPPPVADTPTNPRVPNVTRTCGEWTNCQLGYYARDRTAAANAPNCSEQAPTAFGQTTCVEIVDQPLIEVCGANRCPAGYRLERNSNFCNRASVVCVRE